MTVVSRLQSGCSELQNYWPSNLSAVAKNAGLHRLWRQSLTNKSKATFIVVVIEASGKSSCNDNCASQMLVPNQLMVIFFGSLIFALVPIYFRYDSFKTLLLLGILALILLVPSNNNNELEDIRHVAKLTDDKCVQHGKSFMLVFFGLSILTLKISRTVKSRWQS